MKTLLLPKVHIIVMAAKNREKLSDLRVWNQLSALKI